MTENAKPRWNRAWIIGASTGIGHALAKRIAPQCGSVIVSARSAEKLDALAGDHHRMEAHPVDVADTEGVAGLAARLDSASDPIDLVVVSSGVWHPLKLNAIDPAKFRDAVNVNFVGVINVLAAIVPVMIERGHGHVAIVGSVSGYRGLPNAAAYAPTKAALINLAECIRPELNRAGIDVSIINPGFVDTPMTSVNKFPMPFLMGPDEAADRIARGLAARRYEIAFPTRFVLFLKLLRTAPNGVFFWFINKFILK